jgi:hypothetical protein
MAEPKEGFLARWSRLKREPEPEPTTSGVPESVGADEPTVDLASLPSLESLRGDSDYTPFLQRGVPEQLQRLALRRAWASDPAIAGFRGFAEYDWDCNAPGYGALRASDDILDLCDSILRRVSDPDPPAAVPAPEQPPSEPERPPPHKPPSEPGVA